MNSAKKGLKIDCLNIKECWPTVLEYGIPLYEYLDRKNERDSKYRIKPIINKSDSFIFGEKNKNNQNYRQYKYEECVNNITERYCLNEYFGCAYHYKRFCLECNDIFDFFNCTKCFEGYQLNEEGDCIEILE